MHVRRAKKDSETAQRREGAPSETRRRASHEREDDEEKAVETAQSGLRNLDLDLEHFEIVMTFEIHADIVVGDFHVLRNHRDEFALQRGQIISGR